MGWDLGPGRLKKAAENAGIPLAGPKKAFLIQGEDRIGALYDFHLKLSNAGININACNGAVDGTGRFACVTLVNPADYAEASKASDWRTIQTSPPGRDRGAGTPTDSARVEPCRLRRGASRPAHSQT